MRIILLGFGVVGQHLIKLLISRLNDIYEIYRIKPRIVACIDRGGIAYDPKGLDLKKLLSVKRVHGSVSMYNEDKSVKGMSVIQAIEYIDAEIVIDLTPTNLVDGEPGITNIKTSMKSGKHVVTANKGPLALEFPSLIELANYNSVLLRFSATVGGGTPILEFAKHCLKGENITTFYGILNGTTNYILSKMHEGLTFENALVDAQKQGYAEAEPSLDVDGFDAAAKLVIMANWIMDYKVTMKDVSRKGISGVTLDDVKRAVQDGNSIKLIAKCERNSLEVIPKEINTEDPICVNGILNAVTFSSQYSGNQTIIGRGAGGSETASAILRDLIEIKENIFSDRSQKYMEYYNNQLP